MMKVLLLLLVSISSFAASSDRASEEALQLLTSVSGEHSVVTRMEVLSGKFIGLPYGETGPLGEGGSGRYDQDPLYRFDTFDCTTFVETVLSLAHSNSVSEFEVLMNQIRYENGEVDYLKRNHFPSLQWIPNNTHNGLLREINAQVLPIEQRMTAEAVIDFGGWLQKASLNTIQVPTASESQKLAILNELKSQSSRYSPVIARLDYLPIPALLANPSLLSLIPSGTMVSFVRPNWDLTAAIGTHMNVSHQGLIFQKNGITILRHASAKEKRVVELPLVDYLNKFQNHPTLKGIHLLQPVAQ